MIAEPPETSFLVNVGVPEYVRFDAPEALAEIVPVTATAAWDAPERSIVSESSDKSSASIWLAPLTLASTVFAEPARTAWDAPERPMVA